MRAVLLAIAAALLAVVAALTALHAGHGGETWTVVCTGAPASATDLGCPPSSSPSHP